MKNTYKFVILLLFAGAIASCQKNNTPAIKVPSEMDIVDPEFRSYLIANFDTDVDFKLSGTEIWAVTKIGVGDPKIHSLEGIEIFRNLEKFILADSKVISMDFSKNSKIKNIWLSKNSFHITIYLLKSQEETCGVYDESDNSTIVYL